MNFVKPKYIITCSAENKRKFFWNSAEWWNPGVDINGIIEVGICINHAKCVKDLIIDLDKFNNAVNNVIKKINNFYLNNEKYNIINKIIWLNNTDIICMEDEDSLNLLYNNDFNYNILTYDEYIIKKMLE